MQPITKEYIRMIGILMLISFFAWVYYQSEYAYILMILALLVYIFGSKTKIPEGAAYYSKILVLDIIVFISWTGAMLLVFFVLMNGRDSISGAIVFFLLFPLLPLFVAWHSVQLSSKWYYFTGDEFQWSDAKGLQSVALNDIVSATPYVKRKSLFAPAEMGIVITTKSGNEIKIMSNNLEADTLFMRNLEDLYLAHEDTFTEYLQDATFSQRDEKFNEDLQKTQKSMEEK